MSPVSGAGRRHWLSRAVRLCWSGVVRLPGSQPVLLSQIEQSLVDSGYRYQTSAVISFVERPDAYTPIDGAHATPESFSFEHPDAVVGQSRKSPRHRR